MEDVYLGGVRKGRRGRGAKGKSTGEWLPHKIKLQAAESFRLEAVDSWLRRDVAPGTKAYGDGLACFGAVANAGCAKVPMIIGGSKASVRNGEFVWLNTITGNAKTALRST